MNTSLSHLPDYKQQQLKEITGIIVHAVDPEKVILFGSHATRRWVEGILLYDAGTTPLAERRPVSPQEAKAIARQYYAQWYSEEFHILIDRVSKLQAIVGKVG